MEVYKVNQRRRREQFEWEGHASLTRELLAAVYNTAGKSYKQNFKSSDFIKLSFDKEPEQKPKETREMTPDEIEKKFGKKLKKQ